MELGLIGGGLKALVGGGLFGFLGGALTNICNYFQKKQDHKYEIERIKAESDATLAEAEANIKIVKTQTEGDIQRAEMDAFTTSMKLADKDMFKESYMKMLYETPYVGKFLASLLILCFGMLELLKSFIRPGATLYLLGITSFVTMKCYKILEKANGGAISPQQAFSIFNDALYLMMYLTSLTVGWWFGDRSSAKFLKSLKS